MKSDNFLIKTIHWTARLNSQTKTYGTIQNYYSNLRYFKVNFKHCLRKINGIRRQFNSVDVQFTDSTIQILKRK